MSYPPILGLAGVAGAGKDTTFDRLVALGGDRFHRFSIADPMKESIAALFDVSLERLDELKRDPYAFVEVAGRTPGSTTPPLQRDSMLTMREFMQKYGTEAHRGVFGEDFWLDFWLDRVQRMRMADPLMVVVNTSVRFPNEAAEILELGGEVWTIVGPQDDGAEGHTSEAPLPPGLVTRYVDNGHRGRRSHGGQIGPDFKPLDQQIQTILDEWKTS